MKIELPSMSILPGVKTQAHQYPFQIGRQAAEFIQASVFMGAFSDEAVAGVVRLPGGPSRVELRLGLDAASTAQAWRYLEKYEAVLSRHLFHNTLITIRSHWDWYISRLGLFVEFGRQHAASPELSSRKRQLLRKIGFRPIGEQTDIISEATGLSFGFEPATITLVEEMSRVRNLGVHNRWEVDDYYSTKHSSSRAWDIGELREFDADELMSWHQALLDMLNVTTVVVAKAYVAAPEFDGHPGGS